jgi:protein SCO1/2
MIKVSFALLLTSICVACGSQAKQHTAPAGPTPSGINGFVLKPLVAAPSFALDDQDGHSIGPKTMRGDWFVVAFLYTHCPDVCPLIASNLGVALRRLPNLRVLAISVDPKGDTPTSVRSFLREHRLPARFRYVTGTRAQLAPVWARYHVAALAGPKAIVTHSAFELLVDPHGKERVLYGAQVRATDITAGIKKLTRVAPARGACGVCPNRPECLDGLRRSGAGGRRHQVRA